jgi:hypothetical protein
MKRNKTGFTLRKSRLCWSLSAVAGGILKGQEMITQAKIKNGRRLRVSAAYIHQDRYKAIPGDDPGALARWATASPAVVSGNGNGVVGGTYNNGGAVCTTAVESCEWWHHLRQAGFVAGAGASQPFNALTGILGVQTGDGVPATGSTLLNAAGGNGFVGRSPARRTCLTRSRCHGHADG